MALWVRLRSFWHNVLHRSEVERNMSDELQFHLERRAEDLMARDGLSLTEATRIARLEFGSVERYKEEARQSLGLRLLDEWRGDLRYAFRMLARHRAFTVDRHRDALARHRREHGGVQRRRRAAASQASGAKP